MKINRLFIIIAMAVLLPVLAACDQLADLLPLDSGNPNVVEATFNSLTLKWDKVDGATQYSYTLTESATPDDIIVRDVTNATTVTFSDLKPSTEYTLTVLAYAPVGDKLHTTSAPMVIKARTADLIKIAAPQPVWTRDVNTILVNWPAVDGASNYSYTLSDAAGTVVAEGTTGVNYLEFPNMTTGVYTLELAALTTAAGYDVSDAVNLTIDFVRQHLELWSENVSYSSALLGRKWSARLVAYDDNTYSLLGWYGVEGYNLDFTLNADKPSDMFQLTGNYQSDGKGGYVVPTGLSSMPSVTVAPGNNQCAMQGGSGTGSLVLAVSNGTTKATDSATWVASLESFVGTWTVNYKYEDFYGDTGSYNKPFDVTLGTGENTIVLPLPTYYDTPFGTAEATVDLSKMTFTIQPKKLGSYTFAGKASQTTPITGTISGNKIVFTDYQAWGKSGGTWYDYIDTYTFELTR